MKLIGFLYHQGVCQVRRKIGCPGMALGDSLKLEYSHEVFVITEDQCPADSRQLT